MQWLMLQQEKPEDYVIATGVQHSVREFVNAAARELDMRLEWPCKCNNEHAGDETGRRFVSVEPRYFRPTEDDTLLGDATKARTQLGWKPNVTFAELVAEMVREDFRSAERDALVTRHGF
jgi:GDPmannose 4,6-dehydratase